MLQLEIIVDEVFNEETNEFIIDSRVLQLEHSLVSLSKWESKFEKPFLGEEEKSSPEIFAYVMMMDLASDTPPEVFLKLSSDDYAKINKYIHSKNTATWFNKPDKKVPNRQVVTSELIYYWMTSYEIPWVAETWHLNRLFTLIEVFNEERKSEDSKSNKKNVNRKSSESLAAERRALNEKRKREMNTNG